MLIGHTGDWHLCEGARFQRTLETLRDMAVAGGNLGVKLWLVGGDLYNEQRRPMTPMERLGLAGVFEIMRQTAPVVLCYGNHDEAGELEIFEQLKGLHPLRVIARPTVLEYPGAVVHVVPYPNKRYFRSDTWGIGHSLQESQANLKAVLAGMKEMDTYQRDYARVLLYHGNVGGSRVAGGEQMIGREVELAPHDIDEAGYDYAALSHIHLHQQVSNVGWYAGSPERSNFGEIDDKGFVVVDVARGVAPEVRRANLDTVALVTVELKWDGRELSPEIPKCDYREYEVRVLVHIAEEHVSSLPDIALMFPDAVSVKVEKRVKPRIATRNAAIVEAKSEVEKLNAYWDSLGKSGPSKDARIAALAKVELL